MSPNAFMRSLEDEARRRNIPHRYLPKLNVGRELEEGYWLDLPAGRFEMFQWDKAGRTPVFDTYDEAEAVRLILWHADGVARKASPK